jgi:hypothetical protein
MQNSETELNIDWGRPTIELIKASEVKDENGRYSWQVVVELTPVNIDWQALSDGQDKEYSELLHKLRSQLGS